MSKDDKPIIGRSDGFKQRQVLVARQTLPSVNRMLSDAYQTLGNQLAKFNELSHTETFDVKNATAFNKLITSLTTLQDTERKNTALLELGKLSEAELLQLAAQATDITRGTQD